MPSSLAYTLMAVLLAGATAAAAESPALTIYRADNDALFESGGSPGDGYAIVHEQRALKLAGGSQALVIDGLPRRSMPRRSRSISAQVRTCSRSACFRRATVARSRRTAGEKIVIGLRAGGLEGLCSGSTTAP